MLPNNRLAHPVSGWQPLGNAGPATKNPRIEFSLFTEPKAKMIVPIRTLFNVNDMHQYWQRNIFFLLLGKNRSQMTKETRLMKVGND